MLVALLGKGPAQAEAISFSPQDGWTAPQGLNLFVERASLAAHQGGVMAVARRASKIATEQDELFWATWTAGTGFGAFTKIGQGGFAIGGPSIASSGVALEAVFLGQDFKHYGVQYGELGIWSPFAPFPGGKPGDQAFGPSGIKLSSSGVELWGAYAGDNKTLFVSSKTGPGSTWSFSSAAPTSPVVNTIMPAVQAHENGVTLVYVLEENKRIAVNTLQMPQNTWAGEQTVGADAITGRTPDFLRLGADDHLVVWHGLDNEGIYFSRGGKGVWSKPATIVGGGPVTSDPVVLAGVGGSIAEVLFTRGGALRHARYDGTTFQVNDVAATSNALTVSAARLP